MSGQLNIPDEVLFQACGTAGYDRSDEFWGEVVELVRAAAPVILAAELEQLRDVMRQRAVDRHQIHGDDGDLCEDCSGPDDCHTVAAVTTWDFAANVLARRAAELRGEA